MLARVKQQIRWWAGAFFPSMRPKGKAKRAYNPEVRRRRKRLRTSLDSLDELAGYVMAHPFRPDTQHYGKDAWHQIHPMAFNHAQPLVLLDELAPLHPEFADLSYIPNWQEGGGWDTDPSFWAPRADVRMVWSNTDFADRRDACALIRVKVPELASVRGELRQPMRYLAQMDVAFVEPTQAITQRMLFGRHSINDPWVSNHLRYRRAVIHDDHKNAIGSAFALWNTRERFWSVTLRKPEEPGFLFPTDAVGARALFRLRDLPEGKRRRAALLHWVEGHYRQIRDDPVVETRVRKFLRGQRRFNWNGLVCDIRPSVNHALLNVELASERKREGTANRRTHS